MSSKRNDKPKPPEPLPPEVLAAVKPRLTETEAGMQALAIFRTVSEKVLDRLKQTVMADVIDGTKTAVLNLTQDLGDKLMGMAQTWHNQACQDMTLLPPGTRFVNRRAGRLVLVIEEQPRVRTLLFSKDMARAARDTDRHAVALPYVIFLLGFTDNNYSSMQVAFRNEPLRRLEDMLHTPIFPNIGENLSVCMGAEFRDSDRQQLGTDPCEQSMNLIGRFWQSRFNADLPTEWNHWQSHDARFERPAVWAIASRRDPLFVLQVPWRPFKKLNAMIQLAQGTADIKAQFQTEVAAVIATIQERLRKGLDGIAIGQVRPGELTAQFADVLAKIMADCYSHLWPHCERRLEADREKLHDRLEETLQAKLKDVLYYSKYRRPWPGCETEEAWKDD